MDGCHDTPHRAAAPNHGAHPPPPIHELLARMLTRIEELEAEVAVLRALVTTR